METNGQKRALPLAIQVSPKVLSGQLIKKTIPRSQRSENGLRITQENLTKPKKSPQNGEIHPPITQQMAIFPKKDNSLQVLLNEMKASIEIPLLNSPDSASQRLVEQRPCSADLEHRPLAHFPR